MFCQAGDNTSLAQSFKVSQRYDIRASQVFLVHGHSPAHVHEFLKFQEYIRDFKISLWTPCFLLFSFKILDSFLFVQTDIITFRWL